MLLLALSDHSPVLGKGFEVVTANRLTLVKRLPIPGTRSVHQPHRRSEGAQPQNTRRNGLNRRFLLRSCSKRFMPRGRGSSY